jgi:hypothetical protein
MMSHIHLLHSCSFKPRAVSKDSARHSVDICASKKPKTVLRKFPMGMRMPCQCGEEIRTMRSGSADSVTFRNFEPTFVAFHRIHNRFPDWTQNDLSQTDTFTDGINDRSD